MADEIKLTREKVLESVNTAFDLAEKGVGTHPKYDLATVQVGDVVEFSGKVEIPIARLYSTIHKDNISRIISRAEIEPGMLIAYIQYTPGNPGMTYRRNGKLFVHWSDGTNVPCDYPRDDLRILYIPEPT